MDPAARLRDGLEAFAAVLPGFDQRDQLGVLRGWIARIGPAPAAAAREVLRAFEDRDALFAASLTRDGDPYRGRSEADSAAATREWRLRAEIYDAALALWLAHTPRPIAPPDEVRKLADYGYGSEVWAVRGRFLASCDVGHFMSKWRRDEITPEEAAQALLGPAHFARMILGLQARLQQAGVDPYEGETAGLPDPT